MKQPRKLNQKGRPMLLTDANERARTPSSETVSTPRSGIIGLGMIAEVHARAIRSAGGEITAVAGETLDEAWEVAARWGTGRPTTASDLIASDDVDIVHICTPNYLHAPLARETIAAGKHVVCEKPLATNVTDAEELVRLADEAGVVAATPYVYRYYPTVREARTRVLEGKAGTVRLIHGSYLQDWLSRPTDRNWRQGATYGGASRAFADIGAHWCDMIEFVTGQRIHSVVSTMAFPHSSQTPEEPTEDAAAITFITDAGVSGSLIVSQISPGRKNRLWFEIDGAHESLVFDQEKPELLWVGSREHILQVPRGTSEMAPDALALSCLPAGHPQGYQDCFNAFIKDVHRATRGGDSSSMPDFRDGLRATDITSAIISSNKTRQWVEVRQR